MTFPRLVPWSRDGNGDASRTRRHIRTCWPCRTGRSWSATTGSSACSGAGGFGITYLADEIALARLVTIKEYFPRRVRRARATTTPRRARRIAPRTTSGASSASSRRRRRSPASMHPNIVRVYRYFRANNTGYMVLQFEEGGSFKAWLKGLRRAPRQAELDKMLAPLLEALEIVHDGDFLHRDIAPDNIIVRKDGSPVLIDFGSARGEIASHSKTVSALVKPGYSPYEQYATTSRQQGPWTDIYALGATLYHAVTGKRPPDAPSRMVNDEYVPAGEAALSSYRAEISRRRSTRRCGSRSAERPQSVAEWRGCCWRPSPSASAGGWASAARSLACARRGSGRSARSRNARGAAAPSRARRAARAWCRPRPTRRSRKGQLLDFIDALKKRRPGLAAKKAAPDVPPAAAGPAPAAAPPSRARQPPAAGQRPTGRGRRRRRPAERGKTRRQRPERASLRAPRCRGAPAPRPRRMGMSVAALALARSTDWRSGWASPASPSPIRTSCRKWRAAAPAWSRARRPTWRRAHPPHRPQGGGHGPRHRRPGPLDRVCRRRWHAADVERRLGRARAQHRARRGPGHGACRRRPARAHRPQERRHRAVGPGARGEARRRSSSAGAGLRAGLHRRRRPLRRRRPGRSRGTVRHPRTARAGAGPSRARRAPRRSPIALVGELLASAGADRSIKLWRTRARSVARSWRGQGDAPTALDIAPGGRSVASGSINGSVRLVVDVVLASAALVQGARGPRHCGRLRAERSACWPRPARTARSSCGIWRSGRPPRVFRGHAGPVHALAFSPDGRRLISAGQDGVIRIWSVAPILARD